MTIKHAKLSASGSSKWLNCPGSIKAESEYANESSPYAIEGTFAHELADRCLKFERDTRFFIGEKFEIFENDKVFEKVIDKEMADYVQEYLYYVRSFETRESILYSEMRVDFSNVAPDGFGTLDSAVFLPDEKHLHIFDLKYGQGELVEAYQNTQGMLYALGMLNDFDGLEDIEKISIHICQPRKFNFSMFEINKNDLLEWSKYASKKAKEALDDNAPRVPGHKQCLFCKAKGKCKALADFAITSIKSDFDNLGSLSVEKSESLTISEKETIVENFDLITKFIKSVKDSVQSEIENGVDYPNYKVVVGRSTRKITPEGEQFLVDNFGEMAYTKKLIGVTDADKIAGKDVMKQYIVKKQGSNQLVHKSDKRPALKSDIVSDFL